MRRRRFGLFEFDLDTGELRRNGDIVKLAPQPARVLALLLERPGELVLRETLKAHLWGDDTFVDFERGLNFCVLQVRGALGDASDNPRFVQTVPRKGYRFIAPVSVPAEVAVDIRPRPAEPAMPDASENQTAVRRLRPRWLLAAAGRLAHLIALELRAGAEGDDDRVLTADATAWNAYLKGKALTNSGGATGLRGALVQFEAAAKRDSAFAAAWAKIAETHHLLVMMGAVAPDEAYGEARAAADRAVSADPDLPDAHLARGLVQLWHEWRPDEAAMSFERALSLNPSHAAAHHDYAWSLAAAGRDQEAIGTSSRRATEP